ncbi:MAG: hypothetical protein RIB86_14740 [Imperialibacter sp.]|tara:strand:+ start:21868 stop:22035 length:168 start_codon:yes stop_codon:yes gene_type:complete
MVTVIKKGTPKKEINEKMNQALRKQPKTDLRKLAGSLKTDIDPLQYQKDIRNEWK